MAWFGKAPQAPEGRSQSKLREYAEAIVIAVVLALFIRTYIVQAYKIPSGSMLETLQIGDHLLVNKFLYGVRIPFTDKRVLQMRPPQRGDVVVFKYPEDESKDFIKRVIGLPGDTIEVINKVVYLNGAPFQIPTEQHLDPLIYPAELQPRDNLGPVTVPPGSYFVMGDNRDHSLDSRFWGFVREEKILGKAVVIYWSWAQNTHGVRFDRIGDLIR
ncbi:MAG: signal peptidase I [Nitrospirae bacterium]|nr:signal peptidase I [Nitrospirota bacterium]